MLRSYLAIAFRHIVGQKLYSAINIAGLTVGLACFILIGLYIQHEMSYDRHYANADRIYRIAHDYFIGGAKFPSAATSPQVGPLFKQDFPQVEEAARLKRWRTPVSRDDRIFHEDAVFADNSLFEIFDFEWLAGDATTALVDPWTVVLTESAARKYFGSTDAIGRTLTFEGRHPVRITGVIGNLPENTHLRFDLLVSMPSAPAVLGERALENWYMGDYHTYVLLERGADIEPIGTRTAEFLDRYVGDGESMTAYWALVPERATDIHLRSDRRDELGTPGSITMVYAFGIIAVFILAIACINFMNLATARAVQRANEVGIRKVVGAERRQLVAQFLGESVLLAFIAAVLAAAIVELALPPFNAFLGRTLVLDYFGDAAVLPALGALALLVGLVAGSYPAFHLSAFNPARVLGGDLVRGRGAARFRSALVVLQFAISIALLIATATVHSQILFARNVELGYDKERIIVLETTAREGLGRQWDALKRELLAHPEITQVTASNTVPGNPVPASYFVNYQGGVEPRALRTMLVDFGFFETYGIALSAGRSFSDTFAADQTRVPMEDAPRGGGTYVLNELAAKELGWTPEQAIGRQLEITCCRFQRGPIIGVIENVYFDSIESPIEPTVYVVPPEPEAAVHSETRLGLRQASLRITGDRIPKTLAHIDATWTRFKPTEPVSRRFLDQDFDALYRTHERQAQLLTAYSSLAIFVACLGLFGLASFTTERRAKEIGVRKAMGATVLDIVRLFSSEAAKLVALANVVAWPVAYFAMQYWLQGFAYRIHMSLSLFVGSAVLAIVVALLTVGAVSAQAAILNPIRSLRYE